MSDSPLLGAPGRTTGLRPITEIMYSDATIVRSERRS
jgi:hypothetical protein